MHRTYYRLSDGRQCLMVGMIDLFTFVDMLERDWNAVMKGIPISYGANTGKNIGQTLGLGKKRKRSKYVNDGRPPDTTDDLVDGHKKKKSQGGRPPNLRNHNRNLWAAYPSYRASGESKKINRCWLAAGLESMYALFNPLWLCGISGKGKDIFTHLAHHFSCRSSGELNGGTSIRSTITRGQNHMFEVLNAKYPASFIPGTFCSADYFLEVALDPKLHQSPEYKKLFHLHEHRTFTCELKPDTLQLHPTRADRSFHVVAMKPQMFDSNRIPYSDVAQLVEKWQSTGLIGHPGLVCKACNEVEPSSKPKHKPKKPKKKAKNERDNSIEICHNPGVSQQSAHYIINCSKLTFDKNGPPLHINFHLEVSDVDDIPRRDSFMATTNWPFKLNILWSANISAEKGSLTAVWMHNDVENDGYAQQINRVPSSIAGAEQFTSWLLYSRAWTPSKEEYVNKSIQKIVDDNPDAVGDVPFREMKAILNISHSSTLIAHEGPAPNNSQSQTVHSETPAEHSASPEESKPKKRARRKNKMATIRESEESDVESDVAKILDPDKSFIANQTFEDKSFSVAKILDPDE
ncbi:hypothetical protein PTTG_04193, partial [Puccinia triticina 1-1 BBBD Race 1]